MSELALYVHIPFCKQKCLYCDFPSYAAKEDFMDRYIDSLIIEIQEKTKNKSFKTIFMGGGTPSYLTEELLEKLLIEMKKIKKTDNYEFSIECNPGTLEESKLITMKKHGVNRISFGLQAVQNSFLGKIGRIHSFEEFAKNFNNARKAGFDNINVDLMFGLPNQRVEDWVESLNVIGKLSPEHISAYSLIVEEGTPFYKMYEKGLLELPEEDSERDMYSVTKETLNNLGYHQYEISNYSKNGRECEHNKVYWKCEEYIGVGSSSSSYYNGKRYKNINDIKEYIDNIKSKTSTEEEVHINTIEDSMEEFMFMGLRLMEGIDKDVFKIRFNKDIYSIYGEVIDKNRTIGLLNDENGRIYLTSKGIELSNSIMSEFIFDK